MLPAIIAAAALLAGCGGGGGGGGNAGNAPVIANLRYAPGFAQLNAGGGTVTVTGSVDFTDPDGDVSSVVIETFDPAGQPLGSTTTPVPGAAGLRSGTVTVSVLAPTTVAGDFTFQVFVADATGRTSNRLTGTFSVVAGEGGSGSLVTPTGPSPSRIVVSNGELFWAEASEEPVKKISLAGGPPVALARNVGVPEGLAVAGNDVFWVEGGNLRKVSVGGTPTTLATGTRCAGGADTPVVDNVYAFWVTSECSPDTYSIRRVPISGGTPTTFVTTSIPILTMAADAGNLYWMENRFPDANGAIRTMAESGGSPVTLAAGFVSRAQTFALNGSSVFYTEANFPATDNLVKVSLPGGAPVRLATLDVTPKKLAADETHVYWVDSAGVSALPTAGGAIVPLATVGNSPLDLALRGGDVVWTETTGPAHGETGAVKSVPKAGGALSILFQGGDAPRQLATDETWIYWTEGGPIGLIEGFGRIARVPGGGGATETVVFGLISGGPPIAVNGTHMFIADRFRIKRVSRSGGPVEPVASGNFYIRDLVVDGSFVYWVEDPAADVYRAPVAGGPVVHLASVSGASAGPAGPIRLSGGTIYWMSHYDSILSVPAAGGTPLVIASGLPFLSDFVVDGTSVYFSEQDTGDIRKMPALGGTATFLANGLALSYNILAVDNANLYWIDQVDLGKVSTAGGPVSYIVPGGLESDATLPASIALDNANVYWTEPPLQEIRGAPK